MATGKSYEQIAQVLFVTRNTVTNGHARKILSKLGARNRTEAVAIAAREGLV
jgi:DNA-binding NarL/FixJ family response regulator